MVNARLRVVSKSGSELSASHLQRVEHATSDLHSLREGAGAGRDYEKLLERQLVASMLACSVRARVYPNNTRSRPLTVTLATHRR